MNEEVMTRFWQKVLVTPDHWLWTGGTNQKGYGLFRLNNPRRLIRAHLFAYQWWHGEPMPPGLLGDHWCQNRGCVNPLHLRPATNSQNQQNLVPVKARSGYRNVYPSRGRWNVYVTLDQKRHYGGTFTDPAEADAAARAMRDRLFTHHLDGATT